MVGSAATDAANPATHPNAATASRKSDSGYRQQLFGSEPVLDPDSDRNDVATKARVTLAELVVAGRQ